MDDSTVMSGKTFGLFFLVLSLMVFIGYKVWDANKPLPAKNYSADETRALIMPNLVLTVPPIQSKTAIEAGTLPESLKPFIVAGSGEVVPYAVVYENAKSGFLITYTLHGKSVQEFFTQLVALPGWKRLFSGGSLTFGAVEVQNSQYSVRVFIQNTENTLSIEVQVITTP